MTREETKKAIEVMQAYVDGKEVEYLCAGEWNFITEASWNSKTLSAWEWSEDNATWRKFE